MLVEVALPLPVASTFTYRVEGGAPEPGTRVLVPFRNRRRIGWIVEPSPDGEQAPGRIKSVLEVLEPEPSVPADMMALCRWTAEYYLASLGLVLRAALPAALSNLSRPDPGPQTRRVLRIARELPSLRQRDEIFGRAWRQRECYELLETMNGPAEVSHLVNQLGFSYSVLNGLEEKGLVRFEDRELERDPFTHLDEVDPPDLVPTDAQRVALHALLEAAGAAGETGSAGQAGPAGSAGPADETPDPRPFLLRGVTGSGKTLVYIELLKEVVLRQGRGAIVLVPEIALTPQTVARFRAHFGDSVAVLHSALSDGERYDAWRALRSGDRKIAVGARSAIFAPVRNLGAIVVDEEHESTYKQSETPRYHAREVAIIRARQAGAVCVLGSATPALESWNNVLQEKFRLLELPGRIAGRPLPPVRVIDLRRGAEAGAEDAPSPSGNGGPRRDAGSPGNGGPPAGGDRTSARRSADRGAKSGRGPAPILSPPLVAAVKERLRRKEQSILLLNRRGYSTFVQCRDCGEVWHCPHCNVSLTYHRGRRRLLCHYCFYEEARPELCERCGSPEVSFQGVGTEKVERSVIDAFPGARIARMDVDTTSGKWAHQRILDRVGKRTVDILLGTQMIAKGLDFPGVTLVGVVNADVGMNLPDFRASERTFQLLTQVAGRAGRGELAGEVLVQTSLPGHYAIQAALTHDYTAFAERELEERRGPGYPPHGRMTNVVISGTEQEAVERAARECSEWVLSLIRDERVPGVALLGPAPCPIDRIRGRWRWHFLLRSPGAGALGHVCRRLHTGYPLRASKGDVRIILDRDPTALL